MARVSNSAIEKTEEDSLTGKIIPLTQQLSVAPTATVVTGVQRKANIGNYETVDVYCAVSVPVTISDQMDSEEIKKLLSEAIEEGFKLTSQETALRYKLIKDAIKG